MSLCLREYFEFIEERFLLFHNDEYDYKISTFLGDKVVKQFYISVKIFQEKWTMLVIEELSWK